MKKKKARKILQGLNLSESTYVDANIDDDIFSSGLNSYCHDCEWESNGQWIRKIEIHSRSEEGARKIQQAILTLIKG